MNSIKIINDYSEKTELTYNEKELEEFRKLVIEDKDLNTRQDDIFLLSFLRVKKFNKSEALYLLKRYYEVRKIHKELFANFKPSSINTCLDTKVIGYLPNTDQHGRVIGVFLFRNWDLNQFSPLDIIRSMLISSDFLLNDHLFQVNGFSSIIDVEGLTWRHIIQATPRTIQLALSTLHGSFPVKYKEFHIINSNKLLRFGLSLVSPILPHKLKKRIHIHSDKLDSLHQFIEPKYLPSDFGGELPSYDPTFLYEKLKSNEAFFEENEKYWNQY